MFKENKDDLARKIVVYLFFIGLFVVFASAITKLALEDNQELAYLRNTMNLITIVTIALVNGLAIFCIIELVIKNAMDKKIRQFMKNKEFDKGIAYIENLPKIKIFYDMYERQFYYAALLNLYLDDIEKAKSSFYNINIKSSMLEAVVFVRTTLFLLLIYEENGQTQDKETLQECVHRSITAVKKNRNRYNQNANQIKAIQKIWDNDFGDMDVLLQDRLAMPLVERMMRRHFGTPNGID